VSANFNRDVAAEPPTRDAPHFATPLKQELYRQLTRTSLPSLLRYGDRNSMAFSVEARLPFLDHRLVEFAFGAPDRLLVCHGLTKVLLREAMQPVLPREVYTRVSKLGFPTPEQAWLRGPLRGWLRGVLDKACSRPFVNSAGVDREWRRFLGGGESANLWRVAHTELWWQRFFG
jgi:asparagine synthase (glutamine-hydrolysing)